MNDKGLDFRKKEVINITDAKRLRICSRCVCGFGKRKNNFYYSTRWYKQNIKFFLIRKRHNNSLGKNKKYRRRPDSCGDLIVEINKFKLLLSLTVKKYKIIQNCS